MNRFDSYKPCDLLKPYIKCFAITETDQENTYKVLPDVSMVMGFQYKGRLFHISDTSKITLSTAGITGLQDRFRVFRNSENFGTVLVYFNPTGASSFFREPLHELYSESLSLDHFVRQSLLGDIREQLSEARSDGQRIAIVESLLLSMLRISGQDLLVSSAIQQIIQSKGNIRIKELAKNLYISQAPLEKRFRKVVGASPKKFSSIIRLQSLMNEFSPDNSLTETAHEWGYFDQAHFIKDFRAFTGENSGKILF